MPKGSNLNEKQLSLQQISLRASIEMTKNGTRVFLVRPPRNDALVKTPIEEKISGGPFDKTIIV